MNWNGKGIEIEISAPEKAQKIILYELNDKGIEIEIKKAKVYLDVFATMYVRLLWSSFWLVISS